MTDYTKTTDFTSKDSLPSGDSGKIIRGAEFGTEFDNIQTAVNSKSNKENPSFTGNITVTGTVDGRDIATDGTKLDTIETSADVTDTANVTAAGALMDSEVTNLAQVKAFDSSDYATAAQGTTADNALPKAGGAMTGAITTNSTFDGRDVATDGTKLDGIEALADVTDTTNVTAAGALMDSELTDLTAVKSLNQGVATTDTPTFAGLATSANVTFGDNDKAIFGAGDDLQIYHDGSHSYVRDSGTGHLKLQGTDVRIQSADGAENFLVADLDGAVRIYNDNTQRFQTTSTGIDVTGNMIADGVGIGTSSPAFGAISTGIEVEGTTAGIRLQGATTGALELYHNNGLSTIDSRTATGGSKIAFNTENTERMRIDSNGNVGINNSSPNAPLEVSGAATTSTDIAHFSNSNGVQKAVIGIDGEGDGQITLIDAGNNTDVLFTAGGASYINTGGNFGVGTSSPQKPLHVYHATIDNVVRVESGDSRARIEIADGDTTVVPNIGVVGNNFTVDTNGSERMRINSSGNVGIGTSSPAEPLHVQEGSSGITSKAGTVALIEGSGNTKVSIASGTTSTGELLFGSSADNDAGRIVYDHSNDGLQLWTNGARAVDIDSSGNLLVNGTNATAKMVVDGDANAYTARFNSSATTGQAFGTRIRAGTNSSDYALLVENTSAASMLAVRGDGNVGIGTSTPQASIHTTGDAIIGTTTSGASYEGVLQIADGAVNERTVVLIYNNHPDQFMKLGQDVNTAFIGRDQADEFAIGVFDNAADTTLSKQFVIDDSGNVLVGATTFASAGGGHLLAPSGTRSSSRTVTTAAFHNLFYNANGIVGGISTSGSATTYATSSDQRLKDNIVDAPSASEDIDAIQVRSFDWKADGSHQKYGMVAQELQSVAPEAVSEGETEDDMMGVDYSKLVPMLVKEIQSLRARVAQLETN